MIDYLTHPHFARYDDTKMPSSQTGGGGMGTKTSRVMKTLRDVYPNARVICNVSEIESETVLVEPLRLTFPTTEYGYESIHGGPCEEVGELLEGLASHKAKKILYSSEMAALRMNPETRATVVNVFDAITSNSKFQSDTYEYGGIYGTHNLCDPLPDAFISKNEYSTRKMRIVADGNISWIKNSFHVAEVFKRLKGVVERVYIGSASLWFDTKNEANPQEIQKAVYAHTDRIINEAATPQLAEELKQAQFGLWVAYHDTFSTCVHEMLMSGLLVVAAKHGLAAHIPVWSASGVEAQVEAVKRLASEPQRALAEQSKRVAAWAAENVSEEAFHRQLRAVLKAVWK